jgi:uncharacterized protein
MESRMNLQNFKSLANWIFVFFAMTTLSAFAEEQKQTTYAVDIYLDEKITMRDGIKLSANIYKPILKNTSETLPVIVYMTPYINESIDKNAWFLAERGFIFIAVDVRGRGNSEGIFKPLIQEAKDGHDIVEWAAVQPWSNGKVGMLGGSYVGYTQWATIKEFPPHLKTILPIASVGPGIDFPMYKNIGYPYSLTWLTYTTGKTGLNNIFGNSEFWNQKISKYYKEHLAFRSLPQITKINNPTFLEWLDHPTFDTYWKKHHPSINDYRNIDIPILSITGFYDGDYPGAMHYYNNHMKFGKKSAKKNHFLIIGPWSHSGTRRPKSEIGGINVGEESVINMQNLYYEWYNWTLKGGEKPTFLKDRVAYYSIGDNKWLYKNSLKDISNTKRKLFLSSPQNDANDVFSSGMLTEKRPGKKDKPDTFISNPLAITEQKHYWYLSDYSDQTMAMGLNKNGLIYHSEPFEETQFLAGNFKASLWLSMDVRDADFEVRVFEIEANGTSTYLGNDVVRARYRNSIEEQELVKRKQVEHYLFDGFFFYAKKLKKGSRIRMTLTPINSMYYQKNYQSGGSVSDETKNDAKTATIKLYHSKKYPSYLEVPLTDVEQ